METHLEAGEDGHEGGRTCDRDAALLLNLGLQAGAAHDFGVKALGGKEHDGVRMWWADLMYFVADALAFGADGPLERFACGCDLLGVAGFVGVFEALPIFFGKFGVDGRSASPDVPGK